MKTKSQIDLEIAQEHLAQERLKTRLMEQELASTWVDADPRSIPLSALTHPVEGIGSGKFRTGVVIRKMIPSSIDSPGYRYFDMFLSKEECRDVIKKALGKGWVTADDPLGQHVDEPIEGLPNVEWKDES